MSKLWDVIGELVAQFMLAVVFITCIMTSSMLFHIKEEPMAFQTIVAIIAIITGMGFISGLKQYLNSDKTPHP